MFHSHNPAIEQQMVARVNVSPLENFRCTKNPKQSEKSAPQCNLCVSLCSRGSKILVKIKCVLSNGLLGNCTDHNTARYKFIEAKLINDWVYSESDYSFAVGITHLVIDCALIVLFINE